MILSIDQGTTGTTALVLDSQGEILGRGYSEFRQIFPRPGWVSHDATEIWDTTLKVIGLAIAEAGIDASDVIGIGIANQRETTVLWDWRTGEPVHGRDCLAVPTHGGFVCPISRRWSRRHGA